MCLKSTRRSSRPLNLQTWVCLNDSCRICSVHASRKKSVHTIVKIVSVTQAADFLVAGERALELAVTVQQTTCGNMLQPQPLATLDPRAGRVEGTRR